MGETDLRQAIGEANAATSASTIDFNLTNLALVSIAVSPGKPDLALNVTGQFSATGSFSDGSTADFTGLVTWAPSAPIGATGLASGLALGQSAITASLAGVTSPADTLTVVAPRFVVNTTADAFGFYSDTTSLREAIAGANVVPGQTITFAPTFFGSAQTISLTSGQLELSDTTGTVAIKGPAAGVTVNAGGASRVFQIDSGVTASISGMTISGGSAYRYGGVANYGGNLTLTHCKSASHDREEPKYVPGGRAVLGPSEAGRQEREKPRQHAERKRIHNRYNEDAEHEEHPARNAGSVRTLTGGDFGRTHGAALIWFRVRGLLAAGVRSPAASFPVALTATTFHDAQRSSHGVDAEDVVIARRRKVETDLARLAESHAGTCVDVEAAA